MQVFQKAISFPKKPKNTSWVDQVTVALEDIVQVLVALGTLLNVYTMRRTVLRSMICVEKVIVNVNVNNLQ